MTSVESFPVGPPGNSEVPKGNGCRILVAEDDPEGRESMVELLELNGFEVMAAQDGASALAQLEKGFDPDLVITDLMMPGMSGWKLHEALKRERRWSNLPIIVLCGMPESQRGKLEVEGSFEKPVNSELLLARVNELCGL